MVQIKQLTWWNILKQIPEYIILLFILTFSPFPFLLPPFLIFGGIYLFYTHCRLQQKHIPLYIIASVYLYYGCLFYFTFFLIKFKIPLKSFYLFFLLLSFVYMAWKKKFSLKLCFITFASYTVLSLLLASGSAQFSSQKYRRNLFNEKYVRLLMTSDTSLPAKAHVNSILKTKTVSVRNIFIDEDEKFIYFTTVPPNLDYHTVYPALFRMSLKHPSQFKTLRYAFCNNFVYDKKRNLFYLPVLMKPEILVVDPSTFSIKESIPIPTSYPAGDFFLDEKNDRLIAIPEVGRLWVYELKERKTIQTDKALYYYSAGIINPAESKLYVVSYFSPYLLREYDTNTLKNTRNVRKFFEPSWSFSYNPVRKLFYAAGFFSGNIFVISEPEFKIRETFHGKPGIRPIVADTYRNVLYAGNYLDEYMVVLNNDGKILGKFFVGKRCRSIVLSPKTHRLFVGTAIGILEITIDAFLKDWRKTL